MSEPNLDSLVYVSAAVNLLSPEEIEYLLTRHENEMKSTVSLVSCYTSGATSCSTLKVRRIISKSYTR